ncbi:MAG: ROK family protein [Bacteroidota bacterium]
MAKEIAVGIDIGGTLTKVGLVDREGNLYGTTDFRTKHSPKFSDYLDTLVNKIEELEAAFDGEFEIKGMGVGAPNANYYRGTIEHAANLAWKGIVHFSEELKKKRASKVYITNDANAAAIGEGIYGNAVGMKDFMVITLGTGLGSGIVTNGSLIYGHDAQAGELGHVMVEPGGRVCGTGRRGCLEAYVSSTGIKRTIYALLADSIEESVFRSIAFNDIHGEEITKAAEDGDPIALEAYRFTGEMLGKQLANFVAFSHPETIFLLGGLAKAGKWIFDPTRQYFEEAVLPYYKGKVRIEPSGMIKKNAAILGAAALVWDQEK